MNTESAFLAGFVSGMGLSVGSGFQGAARRRRSAPRARQQHFRAIDEADVEAIAKAFKMHGLNEKTTWPLGEERSENVTVLKYLTRVANEPGRIRRLFEDLQDAKIASEADKKPLTIDYVKEARGED